MAQNNSKPVHNGLFICPNPENMTIGNDSENHGLLPSEIETAIRVFIENGATGIWLFTPGSMKAEHWEAFERAIYADSSRKESE